MLDFMSDPHNRSEFEEVEIDYDIKNQKGFLHASFTSIYRYHDLVLLLLVPIV